MDLRAMLIEARGERRVGDMVHLRASEVDALIEALGPRGSTVVNMNAPVVTEAAPASRASGFDAVMEAAKEAASEAVVKIGTVKTRRSK